MMIGTGEFKITSAMYRTWGRLVCLDVSVDSPESGGNYYSIADRFFYGNGENSQRIRNEKDYAMAYILYKSCDSSWWDGPRWDRIRLYYAIAGAAWKEIGDNVSLQGGDKWGNLADTQLLKGGHLYAIAQQYNSYMIERTSGNNAIQKNEDINTEVTDDNVYWIGPVNYPSVYLEIERNSTNATNLTDDYGRAVTLICEPETHEYWGAISRIEVTYANGQTTTYREDDLNDDIHFTKTTSPYSPYQKTIELGHYVTTYGNNQQWVSEGTKTVYSLPTAGLSSKYYLKINQNNLGEVKTVKIKYGKVKCVVDAIKLTCEPKISNPPQQYPYTVLCSECKQNGSHRSGCTNTVSTVHVGKDGKRTTSSSTCGTSGTSYGKTYQEFQPLIMSGASTESMEYVFGGEPTPTPTPSITPTPTPTPTPKPSNPLPDVSLRKFISEVNGTAVSSREPAVDVSNLYGASGTVGLGEYISIEQQITTNGSYTIGSSIKRKSNATEERKEKEVLNIAGGPKIGSQASEEILKASTISGGSWVAQTDNDGNATGNYQYKQSNGSMAADAWVQGSDGRYYIKSNTWMARNEWAKIGDNWYYFVDSGIMLTGYFHYIGGHYYYFDNSGVMQTGWQQLDGKYYYFDSNGHRYASQWLETSDGWYYLGSDGVMLTGYFHYINGNYYYFNDSGLMQTGWQQLDGNWYYFDSSVHRYTSQWLQTDDGWYYLGSDGKMVTGLNEISGNLYYFNDSGLMQTGWQSINNHWYYFDTTSGCAYTGWHEIKSGETDYWYYFVANSSSFSGYSKGQMLKGRHLLTKDGRSGYYILCENNTDHPGFIEGSMITNVYYNNHIYDGDGREYDLTAVYNHTKSTVPVHLNDTVTYTIRVYNESTNTTLYPAEVKDYLPNHLDFIADDATNKSNGWTVSSDGRTITTTKLKDTGIAPFTNGTSLNYQDLKVVCRVNWSAPYNTTMVNVSEVVKYDFEYNYEGNINKVSNCTGDRERGYSTGNFPANLKNNSSYAGNGTSGNYVKGQEDDDDFDRIVTPDEPDYTDVSLRKFITHVKCDNPTAKVDVDVNRVPQVDTSPLDATNNYKPGTANYNHSKDVVDVHLGSYVTYTIRVYNEGRLSLYPTEVKDYLPAHLVFVADNNINKQYGWTVSSDGRTITTTKLKDTKLNAYVANSKKLSYADLKVVCYVDPEANVDEINVNMAEVTKYSCDASGTKKEYTFDRDSTVANFPSNKKNNNYRGNGKSGNYVKGQEDDDDFDLIRTPYREDFLDLSLRKFITNVKCDNPGVNTNYDRVPNVNTSVLDYKNNSLPRTATYTHTKDIVDVHLGSYVTYTIRVYNEGRLDGYAREVKDHLPEYLEFVKDDATNKKYGWTVSADGRTITTTYMKDTKLNKYSVNSGKLSYTDLQVVCKVKFEPEYRTVLVNIAQISAYAYEENGVKTIDKDRDSYQNNLKLPADNVRQSYAENQEDDDDYERVRTGYARDYVDLSLRKFIIKVSEGSQDFQPSIDEVVSDRVPKVDCTELNKDNNIYYRTATYNHPKEPIDVKRGDLVTYTIRVYNEGRLDAYVGEIKDYIPNNLEFVKDNAINKKYGWTVSNDGKTITTTYTKDTRLTKYKCDNDLKYTDVQVVCKVKDTTAYYEVLLNVAEITVYRFLDFDNQIKSINEDRDSKPANFPDSLKNNLYNGKTQVGKYVLGQEDDDDFERVKLMLTDFSGTVWIDGIEGKAGERDEVLQSNDRKVTTNDGIVHRIILHNDAKPDIQTTSLDSNGRYAFRRRQIKDTYYISFEYRGQEYIPLPDENGKTTSINGQDLRMGYVPLGNDYKEYNSSASEKTEDRKSLNAKFYEIVKGTARNNNANNTVSLEYKRNIKEHTNVINKKATEFTDKTKIQSHTVKFKGDTGFTSYINLGLIERDQVNLGIMTDVDNVRVEVNGKYANYTYTDNAREEKAAIDISYKASDMSHTYDKKILKSDYNFKITDYNADGNAKVTDVSKELEVYITYKILIQNNSSKQASVSGVKLYYDPTFTYRESWHSKTVSGNDGVVQWKNEDKTNKFNTMSTDSIKNIKLEKNQKEYIFVKFQLNKETKSDGYKYIMTGTKNVVAEISGYTTPEGLIDINSEPNDINLDRCLDGNWTAYENTWEDDTDRAPALNISIDDSERTLTGFVFEDIAKLLDQDGVKVGDGFKQNSEQKLNYVTVQLIETVKIGDKTYPYIWQEQTTGNPKVYYMDRNGQLKSHSKNAGTGQGDYLFTNYIPGDYTIRFIYGDQIVDKKVMLSGQDYKYTKYTGDTNRNDASYAKDNKARRYDVMSYSIDQDYAKKTILSNDGSDENNANTLAEKTKMFADTVNKYEVGINTMSPGHNINFGLVERPKSKLELVKTIESVKVTNKSIVLLDTENGIGQVKDLHKTYMELDDELVNGANMQVKYKLVVKNSGDIDTLYNYFEGESKYGTVQEQHKPITSSAQKIYDYAYGLSFDPALNTAWTKDGIDLSILSNEAKANVEKTKKLVSLRPTDSKLYVDLIPGHETEGSIVVLSKVLTIGAAEDFVFNNSAEIVVGRNNVGRKDAESTFGNYLPMPEGKSQQLNPTEPDSDATSTILTEPTGISPSKPNYVLWIIATLILVIGIVLVKVLVLRKKK